MPKYDFGGYATRANLKCSDGRTIRKDAFKDNDGQTVPLVWQHQRNEPENVLGNAVLENRDDGVYAYCTFNDSPKAQQTKKLVEHGDIRNLSIFANQLKQENGNVYGGNIREVSVVLAGANPGAFIDNLQIQHSDGSISNLDDEAIIYTDQDLETVLEAKLEHADDADKPKEDDKVAKDQNGSGKTAQEIFDSMTEEQKNLLYAMVGSALAGDNADNDEEDDEAEQSAEGGNNMKKNVFEGMDEPSSSTYTLTHEDQAEIIADARKCGSLRAAMEHFTDSHSDILEHGVTDLEILFPEAKATSAEPELLTRPMEWVSQVWNGFKKSPMSRIKSVYADLTMDEARAKGYIKGHRKVEEQFGLLKRVTQPTTIYKKQKFDRDDLLDITDFNFVAFIQREMRMMLDEELSRAALIGDGRSIGDDDKIDESCIRPIYNEDEMYAIRYDVAIDPDADTTARANAITDGAVMARKDYRGSGTPTFFTTTDTLNTLMLAKDKNGRRIYNTEAELAAAMRVSSIVEVPVMENMIRTDAEGKNHTLLGIIVNLSDYTIGADRGGAVTMFDDFDIDYNKQVYLIETRLSGSLNKPYSAIILEESTETTPPKIELTADDPTQERYGKKVATLQHDVLIGSDFVCGKLRYVTDYTGIFPSDEPLQSGHFLSLAMKANDGYKLYAKVTNADKMKDFVEVNDGYLTMRITDPEKQKLLLQVRKDDNIVLRKTVSLTNIQLL